MMLLQFRSLYRVDDAHRMMSSMLRNMTMRKMAFYDVDRTYEVLLETLMSYSVWVDGDG